MGAYLSVPSVEKRSDDFSESEKFSYGVSRMQGWRISMEDAHNCVTSLEENTSLFGVYDGHGGSEVAMYCALHFSDVLKDLQSYKDGKYDDALKETFMLIDKMILEPNTIRELKVLADREPDSAAPTEEEMKAAEKEGKEEEECAEDEMKLLHEEATMSIEDLLSRYGKAANDIKSKLDAKKREIRDAESSSGKSGELETVADGSSSGNTPDDLEISPSKSDGIEDANEGSTGSSSIVGSSKMSKAKDEIESVIEDNVEGGKSSTTTNARLSQEGETKVTTCTSDVEGQSSSTDFKKITNNEKLKSDDQNAEDGDVKGKGDAKISPSNEKCDIKCVEKVKPSSGKIQAKGTPVKLGVGDDDDFNPGSDSDSNSEEGFDSDEAVDGCSDSEEEDDEEEEEEESDDEEDPDDIDVSGLPSLGPITKEEPGKDSGTTAVVALLNGNELIVANAGDSRCVLCRDGIAVDMSEDHKPEDESEIKRIKAAGGHVNMQGRVNGGLNLSRAIGDHCYKTNSALDLENQMISAMPDIKKVPLRKGDSFMILACDGIWNVFSSQEVVDFVLSRLPSQDVKEDFKLSSICEELLDTCLAPDTMGDGTGCDNMTCILVKFNKDWLETCQSGDPEIKEEAKSNCDASNVMENNSVDVNGKDSTSIDDVKNGSIKRQRTDNDSDGTVTVEHNAKKQKVA